MPEIFGEFGGRQVPISVDDQGNVNVKIVGGTNSVFRTIEYRVKNAGTGYSLNDLVTKVELLNSTTGVVISTAWYNETQGTVIATPLAADIDYVLAKDGATETTLASILSRLGASPAQEGTDSTGVVQLTGGTGIRGWLSGVFSKIPIVGQALMAASLPVTLASNQSNVPMSLNASTIQMPTEIQSVDMAGMDTRSESMPSKPGAILEVAGSASAVNNDVIASINVSQCTDATIQLSGTWAGTVTFQGCNDNSNWQSVIGQNTSSLNASPASSTTINSIWFIPTPFKYLRIRVTSYTSGTVAGALVGNRQSTPNMAMGGAIGIAGASNVIVAGTRTAGGLTIGRRVSDASTNSVNFKSTVGQVYAVSASNSTASAKFLKLYAKATAPTVGTDTPLMTISIPANSSINTSIGADIGIAFALGIGIGITGAIADNDTTAVAANDVIAQIFYS